MADKKKTSELTTNSSPSTSATLVGVVEREVDGETIKETVQIPITEFVTKDENGGVHIRTKQGKNSIEVCETEDESYTVIQSNALQLHGVSTLRTYDDKEGKDGQVLTKKDGLVIWGDIPSLDGYAKTTDLFSKDYNDLTNKPDIPSIDGLASTSYVDTKVAGIVNSAPEALDTLNELSKALGNDANFSATVATQIGNKVDKENGKGLSTNDYTTAEKNKLAGMAEGANNYSHPDSHPASMITGLSKVATSGSYNDLTDKPTIPSLEGYAKTSDIPSLEGYAKTSDIPSLEGYAKTSDIPDTSNFVTKDANGAVEVESLVLTSKDTNANAAMSIDYQSGILNIGASNSVYIGGSQGGQILLNHEDNTAYVTGDNRTVINTSRMGEDNFISVNDNGDSGTVQIYASRGDVTITSRDGIDFASGENDESYMHIGGEYIQIKSPRTFLEGVAMISTQDGDCGSAGQVLMSGGDDSVYWGNASGGGSPMTSVTYAELKALRDNAELIEGMFYRITDYQCTTAQADTQATDHRFDIIVQALNVNTLSEIAKADHSGDDYFRENGANLSAWEIKYCLDNDTTRFAWADEENGKGVIYYMKDEHGNECPYDFKNIQFKRKISLENGYPELDTENGTETWVYTFCGNSYHIDNDEWSELKDGSLESPYMHQSDEHTHTFCNNTMKPHYMIYDDENDDTTKCGKQYLNNNVFFGYWEEIGSTDPENYPFYYAYGCAFIEIGYECRNNTFACACRHIAIGNQCNDNIFSRNCINIKLGYQCNSNIADLGSATLGNCCCSNVLQGYNLILLNDVCGIDTSSENPSNKIYKGDFEIV